MTDELIEKIKADREAGTPGPWRIHDCESYGDRCKTFYQEVWSDGTDILVATEVTRAHNDGGSANMRRIARVPDMESRILSDAATIEAQAARIEALEAKVAAADRLADGMNGTAQIAHALEDKAISDKWAWVFEDILKEQNEALPAYQSTPSPTDPVRDAAGELLGFVKNIRTAVLSAGYHDDRDLDVAIDAVDAAIRRAEGGGNDK